MFQKLESFSMSKSAITRLFKVAVALVVAGSVTGAVVVIAALANGAVAFGGAQFITVNPVLSPALSPAWPSPRSSPGSGRSLPLSRGPARC
jgi:hypothetical protein